ncbi:MAG: saccharopine dehydrogenase NADP-binding domain-containing protein [Chloroflexota bacterium]
MSKISFNGSILILGCGSVSQCLQPLLLQNLDIDFKKITIMDFLDMRHTVKDMLDAGASYVQERITRDNMDEVLDEYVGVGDMLIDLAWNIDCCEIMQWCHDHTVMYINTSVEIWDPYEAAGEVTPMDRTLYVRHMALRRMANKWTTPGATAVIEHGANPGLVSHWTKVALEDIAREALTLGRQRKPVLNKRDATRVESYLADQDWARLAMTLGVKVIHISERDTQIGNKPKEVGEFVNTWSVEGFREEGVAPAELGWGTHERRLPLGANKHLYGPGNQICLSQCGIDTYVRSWVPDGGEINGMVVRHGEAFTISDYLTVWEDAPMMSEPLYRPTVHYAYMPCDSAIVSLWEMRMKGYKIQDRYRIMKDEIVSGKDELGVLLLGHCLNGWWVGSQLSIEESRRLVPGQNATTVQVCASILGAMAWMIRNPRMGFCVADELPHREVLDVANQFLGTSVSVQTNWSPLQNRVDPFEDFGKPRPSNDDEWQFETFLLR